MQYKKRYTFNRIDQDLAPDKRDSFTHLNIDDIRHCLLMFNVYYLGRSI